MKIIACYCDKCGSNMYVCGPDGGGLATVVDPAPCMDEVVRLLSVHNYEVGAVVVTYPSECLARSVRTVSRMFPVTVYAGCDSIGEIDCHHVSDSEIVKAGKLEFEVLPILAHSRQSVIYRIEKVFFTGPILQAGTIGETPNPFAEELLIAMVKDTVGPHGEESVILPGVGPATTLRAELNLNPYFRRSESDAHF